MCRACNGSFPTAQEFRALADGARLLLSRVTTGELAADDREFVQGIESLDRQRFNGPAGQVSPEWGQPQIAPAVEHFIFRADPSLAITLFVLTCWYDAQEVIVLLNSTLHVHPEPRGGVLGWSYCGDQDRQG